MEKGKDIPQAEITVTIFLTVALAEDETPEEALAEIVGLVEDKLTNDWPVTPRHRLGCPCSDEANLCVWRTRDTRINFDTLEGTLA